ncbi:MAG: hypothetical protein UV63_C0042G0002 [Microgenomates group bacterium GW2011_GWC1_43_11]|uniref:Glycosyltransferase RgtA/B/C/D-like domain-containing protein n=2 Tax=Candidatus Gottesmaniibacteriota TaxID=1752720 RepID=A0A0G1LG38_9BACT|nr:MAG: hypothetical protein UV63_C0042G0002 [Microgenomates group bacterium GW2011_GWC1_43_11]KKT37945.1 MAG: hypothetical protein UW22_C0016G0008 [Candidatus Gottesmanbacteria bacterium GW2011_GWB1_44_11c]KKT58984.1 MAG: hypothetical protein UW52_C0053G0001 [Candidatus Gottesmanbacteria bacterium GW2011_GWA1_44_24b]
MMRFLTFFKKETTIAGILIAMILGLSLLPDIIKWQKTPPGRVYIPIHNNLYDYALYVNYIRQGLDGQSVLFDRFTTEEHQGTLANPFYLVLGRIWRITGIRDAHIVYLITRILLGLVWTLIVYGYIRRSIQSKTGRILALFFVLYGASVPLFQWSEKGLTISSFMAWWSELDPLSRATFLPAHLMGHILLLLTITLFTFNYRISKTTFWRSSCMILGTITGFFAGLFHTPSLTLPLLLLPIWAVLTKQWKRFVYLLILLPLSALSLLILSGQFQNMPWTLGWDYERLSFAVSFPEYLLALGPIVPFAFLGVFVGNSTLKARLVWILWIGIGFGALLVTPVLFQGQIAAFRSFPISNIRFLQLAINVPLSILAGFALLEIRKRFGYALFYGLVGIVFILTFIGYPACLGTHITNQFGGPLFQYPTRSWMEAIRTLDAGDRAKAVLSMPFAGLAIAMNTDRTVYIGRLTSTVNIDQKTDLAWKIYGGTMPVCEAYSLLTDNRISEVFVGYDEKIAGGDLTVYPFLRLKQDFGDTQIYQFTGEKPAECP